MTLTKPYKWTFPLLFGVVLASSFTSVDSETLPEELDQFIQRPYTLSRYVEGGYSPLGRSPVVDAVLGDPFYLPRYAEVVAREIRARSETKSLFEMSSAVWMAGGIPLEPLERHLAASAQIPESFVTAFGKETATVIDSHWKTFMQVYADVEVLLSVLSKEEKQWLRDNYNRFFFGEHPEGDEYAFFTTNSPMPLKFFELAARVDLAKLADCARRLAAIVDDVYAHGSDFLAIVLPEDFIWEEQGLKLIVSTRSHVKHTEEADFFIDLGGSNWFQTRAGGTGGIRAAALHLDLFGGNVYQGGHFVQGSGFLGVGILASYAGNNSYSADAYAQGCGFFGVGALMNLKGNNEYTLKFGGQSFALFGSSLLWNRGGGNHYSAKEGMAQAASSTLGVAFLVDNEGNNTYVCGVLGQGGKRAGGIGQGGSTGVRGDPWLGTPSFYGGVSFLYNSGSHNRFEIPWLGQGSAYFLSAGILVAEGSDDTFRADYDAQGQGLHLAAGLLLKRGGNSAFKGGWGSIGVGADRSVGMLINTEGNNTFQTTDQGGGTARKPAALGVFIDLGGNNRLQFGKTSAAHVQMPQSPNEWPTALFLELGQNALLPQEVREMKCGAHLCWGDEVHEVGIVSPLKGDRLTEQLFAKFPAVPRLPFPFDPLKGWKSNVAYLPLPMEPISDLVQAILKADYEKRRQLYEAIDLKRFSDPKLSVDLTPLLKNPARIPEDQFNYAALWALQNQKPIDFQELLRALEKGEIVSDSERKMAIALVGILGKDQAIPILGKVMKSDPVEENRYLAALILTKMPLDAVLPLLKQGAESNSEMVRYAVAKGLRDRNDPQVLALVKTLFRDPSFYVRRAAALTAISLHDRAAIPVLIDTFQYETLDTTDNYGDNIFNDLAGYAGVNFGLDKDAWKAWWKKEQNTFDFPNTTQAPQ